MADDSSGYGAYGDAYGSLANYFSSSGGSSGANRSPGKTGGAGYREDVSTGQQSQGDVQTPSATSGSGWISAAASMAQDDKSSFATTFNQQFGGITNNQIIDSPNSTGASTYSPNGTTPVPGLVSASGNSNGLLLLSVIIAAAAFFLKRG